MTTPDPQYSAPAPKAASSVYIRLADLLVGVGALLILVFSWAPMISISGFDGDGRSLWRWLSPLGLFVILGVLVLLGTAVVDTWWHREKQIVGLNRHHLQVGAAIFVLVDLIGMTFTSAGGGSLVGPGYGGILDILFALVATAGAVLNHFGQLQNPIGLPNVSVTPAAPAAYVPPQSAAPADTTTPADPAAS